MITTHSIIDKARNLIANAAPWGKGRAGLEEIIHEAVRQKDPEAKKAANAKLSAEQAKRQQEIRDHIVDMESKLDAILPKLSAQAKALIGERPAHNKKTTSENGYADILTRYFCSVEAAVAAGPAQALAPAAAAPVPVPAVTVKPTSEPVAKVATPPRSASVEKRATGAEVLAAVLNPDPAISGPAVMGISRSLSMSQRQGAITAIVKSKAGGAKMHRKDFDVLGHTERNFYMAAGGRLTDIKAEANTTAAEVSPESANPTLEKSSMQTTGTPDFSFIGPFQHDHMFKQTLRREFEENGGLVLDHWIEWARQRKVYCETYGAAPETMKGLPVVFPAVVLETKTEAAERLAGWARSDQYFVRKIAELEAEIVKNNARELSSSRSNDATRLKAALEGVHAYAAKNKKDREANYALELKNRAERSATLRAALF